MFAVSSVDLVGGYFAPQTVVDMDKPGCVICEFVMHRLREWLEDGHTQDEIQEGLAEICAAMPSSLKVYYTCGTAFLHFKA